MFVCVCCMYVCMGTDKQVRVNEGCKWTGVCVCELMMLGQMYKRIGIEMTGVGEGEGK